MDRAGLGLQSRLDGVLTDLLRRTPQLEAAAVVSFDGLPMASCLPEGMDEDRVAAMSAALLSLGERAADGLGRGSLSQVFVEGDEGTVYLISADDEAVLVAVSGPDAKPGLMLFEVKRAARAVAAVLAASASEPVMPASRIAAHSATVADVTEGPSIPTASTPTTPPPAAPAAPATVTVVPAPEVPVAAAAEPGASGPNDDAQEPPLGAPRIVAPRSPADLVPPATPPTILTGARTADPEPEAAPNVVWTPNGHKPSWS